MTGWEEAMGAEEARFRQLHLDIAVAERRLLALRTLAAATPTDPVHAALHEAHQEIGRLREAGLEAAAQLDSARIDLANAVRCAQTDALTGLPNRSMLWVHLERELATARRTGLPMAVLFIDLDHFKAVNDTLGHLVGDLMLCRVAQRLRDGLRGRDTICRFGGDEFIILMPEVSGDDLGAVTAKIRQAVCRPLEVPDGTVPLQISIGTAVFPDDGSEAALLVRRADESMYRAKARSALLPAGASPG